MDISKFLVKHTGGKKSLTATAFIVGFMIVNLKFLTGGLWGTSAITGVDYGAAIAALGGIYALRRNRETSKGTQDPAD
jgi:hypothetical protein